MAIFAVQLTFDPSGTEARMQVRPAHRDYLAELQQAGKLVAAGPFADESGALLLYDVADEAELRDILAKDPYTPAGVAEVTTLKEWNRVFGA
ncbi:muconolactone Delta-isomerase family protein [Kribbella sp. NPDC051770]|uniref:YciI family protein n=1 Tax=Kribbella sp. NPDC051770 TaxID=3155413 RepID=UPI003425CE3C